MPTTTRRYRVAVLTRSLESIILGKMFLTHVQLFYDALLTVAYPQVCAMCRASVEQRRFGVVCEACWQTTPVFNGQETLCWKCGVPAPAEKVRCRRCDSQSFTAARAAGLYEAALRETVLQLKRKPHLPEHVEALLVGAAKREPLNVCTRIVPVPLHAARLRARGFNQASIIAHALAKSLRLPLDEVSLVRVSGSEKYRAGLDAKGRHDTVAGAFAVPNPRVVLDENILLVDDVFTTGATVSACAEVLKAAGAKGVFILTVARASRPR
jgi:ComF family protein